MKRDPAGLARQARRERRIERRRTEILEAAAQVFAERGYENTTTRDIAAAVDLGESTLYNYFQNKREILRAIIDLKRAEMDRFLAQIDQIEGRAGLITLIDQAMALWLTRVHFTRTVIGEALRDAEITGLVKDNLARILALIKDYLARHIRAGRFRAVDPDRTAQMVVGLFFSVHLPFLYGAQPLPTPGERRQYAEAMADLLLTGLALPARPGRTKRP